MRQVQLFDTVSVSYTATIPGGEVFEGVPENAPITLTIDRFGPHPQGSGSRHAGHGRRGKQNHAHFTRRRLWCYDPQPRQDIPCQVFSGRLEPKPGMLLSLAVELAIVKKAAAYFARSLKCSTLSCNPI